MEALGFGAEVMGMVTIEELHKQTEKLDLPDKSVELLFVSDPEFSKGNRSKLFTIRTVEQGDAQQLH